MNEKIRRQMTPSKEDLSSQFVMKLDMDVTDYDRCGCKPCCLDDELSDDLYHDEDAFYEAIYNVKKAASWKEENQRLFLHSFDEINQLIEEIENGTYYPDKTRDFVLNERGKVRWVSGEKSYDKVVKHLICDNIINPAIRPRLIYDTSASIVDRGISFARKRILVHLHKYYNFYGTNEGYVLLIDFSKYYDNIRHDVLYNELEKCLRDDPKSLELIRTILDSSKIDVSYTDDKEYENAMNQVFNSLEYHKIDPSLLTGEKFIRKHLNIGDQFAQSAGGLYPLPLDNFIKIVRGEKFYARYNDDCYIIHPNKEHLQELLDRIIEICGNIGIFINRKKTRIIKLSGPWKFLQIRYQLTKTGHVIMNINRNRLYEFKKRMKKLVTLYNPQKYHDYFKSWFNNYKKYMSYNQRCDLIQYYKELSEQNVRFFTQVVYKDRQLYEKLEKKMEAYDMLSIECELKELEELVTVELTPDLSQAILI